MTEAAAEPWALRCPFCRVIVGGTSWCTLTLDLPEGNLTICGAGFAAFRCRNCGGISESRRSREGRIFLVRSSSHPPNRYARVPLGGPRR